MRQDVIEVVALVAGFLLMGVAARNGWRRDMGDVKNAIKGSAPAKPSKKTGDEHANILEGLRNLKDQLSTFARTKDQDALDEGPNQYAENVRKAALLRASHALISSVVTLLEDY